MFVLMRWELMQALEEIERFGVDEIEMKYSEWLRQRFDRAFILGIKAAIYEPILHFRVELVRLIMRLAFSPLGREIQRRHPELQRVCDSKLMELQEQCRTKPGNGKHRHLLRELERIAAEQEQPMLQGDESANDTFDDSDLPKISKIVLNEKNYSLIENCIYDNEQRLVGTCYQ